MKHIAWLKDRSPHRALDGKSPYEIKHKEAPHLANICEFGTVAYVKDLKVRKLDPRAKLRQFMGYDSESKGFHIYWPNKWSVTVEHNVIFNQEDILTRSDHVVIPGDVLSEGEREKLIQHPENTAKTNDEQPDNQNKPNLELQNSEIPESSSNSIPFPPSEEPQQQTPDNVEIEPVVKPNMGHCHRVHHPPGHYAKLNKGLDVKLAAVEESDGEDNSLPEEAMFAAVGDMSVPLLADFALRSLMGAKPKMLDEVLCTPCTKEWQAAYDYEITQLEKLSTWDIVRLPPGKTPIPHSLVFRGKLGADGSIDSWHVQLVASGHRQKYGVDYDETFATVEKMPSI